MPDPMFTIIIPTRERHRTLASAIQSVLQQEGADFELIVQDNCSSEDTWKVVRNFKSPRLKYNRSPYVLPMNENWEQALPLATGEWIFYLGDDDAMMPDGIRLAAVILERAPMEILMWEKYTYWWDDALEPAVAGRMFLHLGHHFEMQDPRQILRGYYNWELGFGALPSVYTAFVRRKLIGRVKEKTGKYFLVGAPDNFTGIANAFLAESAGKFQRGLSLCGNSGQSTGCSYFFRSKGERRRRDYHAEEGKDIAQIIHPALVPSVNLEIGQADMQLRAKEILFPEDTSYQVPMLKVLHAIAANINRDPESYDETLQDLHSLARKLGVEPGTIPVPPRAEGPKNRLQGPIRNERGEVQSIAVNCAEAGVHDAFSAARLAGSMLPVLSIQ